MGYTNFRKGYGWWVLAHGAKTLFLYLLSRSDNQSRVGRDVLLQELHLVGQDAAVGEESVLPPVWDVRPVKKLHGPFLPQALALVGGAKPAGGDDLYSRVAAPARD